MDEENHALDAAVYLAPRAGHTCHYPGCKIEVPPRMWGCRRHWYMLPIQLRNKIWRTYVPGQEVTKTPSPAYISAAREVQHWILSTLPQAETRANTLGPKLKATK